MDSIARITSKILWQPPYMLHQATADELAKGVLWAAGVKDRISLTIEGCHGHLLQADIYYKLEKVPEVRGTSIWPKAISTFPDSCEATTFATLIKLFNFSQCWLDYWRTRTLSRIDGQHVTASSLLCCKLFRCYRDWSTHFRTMLLSYKSNLYQSDSKPKMLQMVKENFKILVAFNQEQIGTLKREHWAGGKHLA